MNSRLRCIVSITLFSDRIVIYFSRVELSMVSELNLLETKFICKELLVMTYWDLAFFQGIVHLKCYTLICDLGIEYEANWTERARAQFLLLSDFAILTRNMKSHSLQVKFVCGNKIRPFTCAKDSSWLQLKHGDFQCGFIKSRCGLLCAFQRNISIDWHSRLLK